jgi:hypothetical protein
MSTDLRQQFGYLVSEDTREIMDRLLGEFMLTCIGKNDMSLVSALMTSATIIVAAHCQRTGDDYWQTIAMARDIFEASATIAGERKP